MTRRWTGDRTEGQRSRRSSNNSSASGQAASNVAPLRRSAESSSTRRSGWRAVHGAQDGARGPGMPGTLRLTGARSPRNAKTRKHCDLQGFREYSYGAHFRTPQVVVQLRRMRTTAASIAPDHRVQQHAVGVETSPRPRWIHQLVVDVLAASSQPLTPREVIDRAEMLVGTRIAPSSIRNCLRRSATRTDDAVERLAYGRYRLRRDARAQDERRSAP